MDYKDLKKDTEDLYKKQCEVKYGLIELDIMFPQYKIPYNNDRLKDSVYLLMYRLLLRLILDGVKKICWSKCNDDTKSKKEQNNCIKRVVNNMNNRPPTCNN